MKLISYERLVLKVYLSFGFYDAKLRVRGNSTKFCSKLFTSAKLMTASAPLHPAGKNLTYLLTQSILFTRL